ncbi:MAG TPA: hypothetical protein VLA37_13890 [Sphingomonadaceae bacterium]|nr:hypothetical protein [Sphingomonadaceae bacterium]
MTETAANVLKARLRADLKPAMIERRKEEAALLRTLLAAIDNAEAPAQTSEQASAASADFGSGGGEVDRLDLSEADLAAILWREITDREENAAEFARRGVSDREQSLLSEADLIRRYLP